MLKVKISLDYEEICFVYRLLVRINEHALTVPLPKKKITHQITFAAADELTPLFARKLIRPAKKERSFTFSRLHAVMLKVILQYFARRGETIDEVFAYMVLSKLDPKL